jgi:hypothetical protein
MAANGAQAEKARAGQEKTSIPGRAAVTWGQVKIPPVPGERPDRKNAGKA